MPTLDNSTSSDAAAAAADSLISAFKMALNNDNSDGWGPSFESDQFKDLPYQKFSKSDRIGKVH